MKAYPLRTTARNSFTNITREVAGAIRESGIQNGICIIFCPHTTAAITINENADPDVQLDMAHALERISPELPAFRHGEGNSDAHVKSSLVGASELVIVADGAPALGIWQGIYFCEFDGPRNRQFFVQVMEG